jgi:hypothetical protein
VTGCEKGAEGKKTRLVVFRQLHESQKQFRVQVHAPRPL